MSVVQRSDAALSTVFACVCFRDEKRRVVRGSRVNAAVGLLFEAHGANVRMPMGRNIVRNTAEPRKVGLAAYFHTLAVDVMYFSAA
jgi:hypothetical protein